MTMKTVLRFLTSFVLACTLVAGPAQLLLAVKTPAGGGSPTWYYSESFDETPTGTELNFTDVNWAKLSKIVVSSSGTATKLGVWLVYVNATSDIKIGLFDSGRNSLGSTTAQTITSGNSQWHDFTISIGSITSGTYYVGIVMDGPNDGSLVGLYNDTNVLGDEYITYDSGSYSNFPGSLTGLNAFDLPIAVRVEITP